MLRAVSSRVAATSCLLVAFLAACAHAAVLPSQITADMTLSQADSPWEMQSHVTLAAGAQLTIEPGVTVIARGDYRLTISGSLQALAPPGGRIVFRATDSQASGAWRGLYFTQGAVGRLRRCTIRSAQDNVLIDRADVHLYACNLRLASRDGVMAWGDCYLKAVHCVFQNNGRYGVQVQTSEPSGVISFSDFVGNGQQPVYIKATCVEMLHGGNSYAFNGISAIGVDCGSLTDIEDIDCWRNQGIPYDLSVASPTTELVIAEGALLKVQPGTYLYPPHRIVVRGRLTLDGRPDRRVILKPPGTPAPGDWKGLTLDAGALGRFISSTISHAENGLVLDSASVYMCDGVVKDCEYDGIYAVGVSRVQTVYSTIKNCGRSAIRLPDSASGGNIHDCTITGCGDYPVFAIATNAEALRGGNTYSGNAIQAIGVACSQNPDIRDDDAWIAQGVPFDLTARPDATYVRIAPGARLTLRAGVEVVGGGFGAEGIFVAAGTSASPVSFASASDAPVPGDWTGIEYLPGSAGRLVHAIVSHAYIGATVASAGNIRLTDSLFRHCERDGIRVTNNGAPLITGCTCQLNQRHGVNLRDNARPLLGIAGDANNPGRNCLLANGGWDLRNGTPNDLRAENNWWGTTDPAQIRAHTYDWRDDPSLGKIDFQPALGSPPSVTLGTAMMPLPHRPLAIISICAAPTASGIVINVRLSRPAHLQVLLRNIAGRPVRHLTVHQAPASAVITWDGRSDLGAPAPAGQYLIEAQAHSADGNIARALAALTLQPR